MSAPQLGKTIVLAMFAIVSAVNLAQAGIALPVWWTAPTYGMASQGLDKLAEMARSANLLRNMRQTPSPRVLLRGGGIIEARSWEQPENLFGPTVGAIAVDEFGYLTTEAHAALRSRVSETRIRGLGFMRYAGNVGEIGGEAEAIWTHANSGAPGWAARTWTWRDRADAAPCGCGLNGDGCDIELAHLHESACERGRYLSELSDLRNRMSAAHFRQLYGAEWLDWSALPAYTFDRSVHVSAEAEYDPALPIDLACDFNVDPMAWILGQHKGREAWAFDEVILPGGATTEAACAEVNARLARLGRDVSRIALEVYGDRSGNSRSTKSNLTDYQIIRQRLGNRPQFAMNVPEDNGPVTSRLNAVNAMLRSGTGEVRYRVHPRCVVLANDLARVALKPGTRDLDKSNRSLTHASDADGYRIVRLFPVDETPRVSSVGVPSLASYRRDTIMGMDS